MIEIKHVQKEFDRKKVLADINLDISKGETLAIIGPSGCGKSTLLRLLIRLIEPTTGQIFIKGQEITKLKRKELSELRRGIGMVFQSSALFDSLSVKENVAFGLREHKTYNEEQIDKIVREKLSLVELEESLPLMPDELSGGMQKRVSLARAIAANPELILYDEPTTGLDPLVCQTIENLMSKFSKELGVTSVLVTHQLTTVMRVASRVVMLHEGRLIPVGTPKEMWYHQNPIVREFIEASGLNPQ